MIYELTLRRHDNTKPLPTRDELQDLLFNPNKGINTPLAALIPLNSGYKVKTDIEQHIHKLHDSAHKLHAINLHPILPPHAIAQRTVIVRQADPAFTSQSPDTIKSQIISNEHNAGLNIDKIIHIPNKTHIFKIQCGDVHSATHIIKHGFYAHYYRFAPTQTMIQTHHELHRCYKCYRINEHSTTQCQSQQKCSNCTLDHHHTECPNTDRIKCVNCKTNHHTLAYSCPYRKHIIKQLEQNNTRANQNNTRNTFNPTAHFPQLPRPAWNTPAPPPPQPNYTNRRTLHPPQSQRPNNIQTPQPNHAQRDPRTNRPKPMHNHHNTTNTAQPSTSSHIPPNTTENTNTTPTANNNNITPNPSPKRNAHQYISDIVSEKMTDYIKEQIAIHLFRLLEEDTFQKYAEQVFTSLIKEHFLKTKKLQHLVNNITIRYTNINDSDTDTAQHD